MKAGGGQGELYYNHWNNFYNLNFQTKYKLPSIKYIIQKKLSEKNQWIPDSS